MTAEERKDRLAKMVVYALAGFLGLACLIMLGLVMRQTREDAMFRASQREQYRENMRVRYTCNWCGGELDKLWGECAACKASAKGE